MGAAAEAAAATVAEEPTTVRSHCIKYVTWSNVAQWRDRVKAQGDDPDEAYPYAFGSNDAAILRMTGHVLWLVTLPRYKHRELQAPSLVARLTITESVDGETGRDRFSQLDPDIRRGRRYAVVARRDASYYLPLNNAFSTLLELRFDSRSEQASRLGPAPPMPTNGKGRKSKQRRSPYAWIPGKLQRHRWLTDTSITQLEDYASAVRRGRRVFLSYKRADFPGQDASRTLPGLLASELHDRQISCWWDRWNLPQPGERQDAWLGDDLLEDLLGDAVKQAAWFVALIGTHYARAGEESWPRREWRKAGGELDEDHRRHLMHRLAVYLTPPDADDALDRWVCDGDASITLDPDSEPSEIAAHIDTAISRASPPETGAGHPGADS